jgi:hypothetical protein
MMVTDTAFFDMQTMCAGHGRETTEKMARVVSDLSQAISDLGAKGNVLG